MQSLLKLRRFAASDHRQRGPGAAPTLTFVAHIREKISGVVMDQPCLIAILEGQKEIWQAGRPTLVKAGCALALPQGWTGDVVNIPGQTGVFRALVLLFDQAMLASLRKRIGSPASRLADHRLAIDDLLGETLVRAFEGLETDATPQSIVQHRIAEVGLLLLERGAFPSPAAGAKAVAPRLRTLVRSCADRPLGLAQAASQLNLSPATLKRRLAAEGLSFSQVVAAERMALASDLMAEAPTSLTQIAGACGYRSVSKFSRRFRTVFGVSPVTFRTEASRTG